MTDRSLNKYIDHASAPGDYAFANISIPLLKLFNDRISSQSIAIYLFRSYPMYINTKVTERGAFTWLFP